MSVLFTVGSALGKTAAYAVQGSALAGTQLALGAQEGYVTKAAELRSRREALSAAEPAKPVAQRPLKPQKA